MGIARRKSTVRCNHIHLIERHILKDGIEKIETKMFNGYAEEVAGLYAGMDLKKNF